MIVGGVVLGSMLAALTVGQTVAPVAIAENHLRLLQQLGDPRLIADTAAVEETLSDDLEIAHPDPEVMPVHPSQHDAAFMLVTELAISRSHLDRYECRTAAQNEASCDLFFLSNDGRCSMSEIRHFSVRDGKIVRIVYNHNTGEICDG